MEKTCIECGVAMSGPQSKKFCSNAHAQRFKRKNRPAVEKVKPPSPVEVEVIARALSDNFFLPALAAELATLRAKPQARAALEKALRTAISENPVWPSHSPAGKAALLLWLLSNPAVEVGGFHHPHERRRIPGVVRKPTGTGIRAYGTPGSRV
jgi:hypothetical protein